MESGGQQLNPVHLHCGLVINVPAQDRVELRGRLSEKAEPGLQVYPRSSDWLPNGITVSEAKLVEHNEEEQYLQLYIQNSSNKSVELKDHHVLAELHHTSDNKKLEAVVGPVCETTINVDGIATTGLIDSGSQVTIISESFYRDYLKDRPIEQLESALGIMGAGGQTVPYLGVISVPISLPPEVGGSKETVDTYAVVCPDTKLSRRVPVIVGTNTLRRLAGSVTLPIRCEMAFAYREASTAVDGRLGDVRLPRRNVTIKPHDVLEVRGKASRKVESNRDAVLVQEPVEKSLPDGLHVVTSKTFTKSLPRVRVTLCNTTDNPITLKGRTVIADLFAIQEEYAVSSVIHQLQSRDKEEDAQDVAGAASFGETKGNLAERLRFGDDLPEAWKARMKDRLIGFY